jgi:hypothetical protein
MIHVNGMNVLLFVFLVFNGIGMLVGADSDLQTKHMISLWGSAILLELRTGRFEKKDA